MSHIAFIVLMTAITLNQVSAQTVQAKRILAAGYDISRLDNYTQLKVFLYTWMSMETTEGG